jgi:hypothetical protein
VKQTTVAAFCRALWRGETDVVQRLLPRVDPNGRDRWGQTPLLAAAEYGDLTTVSRLVERGAAIEQGRRHLTPLTLAARRSDADLVAYLRREGAVPSIFTWVRLGRTREIARALARDPAQARLRDELGMPLVHHAVEALRPAIVTLVLDRGASVDARRARRHAAAPPRGSAAGAAGRGPRDGHAPPRARGRPERAKPRRRDASPPGRARPQPGGRRGPPRLPFLQT